MLYSNSGDNMIEKLKPVFLAVFVGCISAVALFKTVEKETLSVPSGNVVAIQLGVFKDEGSANKMKDSYGGEVFEDDGIYRVYYSILNDDANIDFVTDYLQSKDINYYLKSMKVSETTLKKSLKMEKVMLTISDDAKWSINKELLNMYKEVI